MPTRSRLVSLCCLALLAGPAAAQDVKKEDVPKLIKDLKHGSAKVRIAAADDLGRLGALRAEYAKPAVPSLLELVKKDSDAKVRAAAARALGRMMADPKEAVPVLTEALKDKAMAVRVAAATALGQFGPDAKEALPALQQVVQEARKNKQQMLLQAAGTAIKSIRSK
jgi:HEAT repeat protein